MPLLLRERVFRGFSETAHRVTLIAAGAGFGKSVAIRQLREAGGAPMVHYEVRADNFTAFVRGFVESAAHFAPGLQAAYAGAIELAMQSSKPHEEAALWMLDHLKAAKIESIAIEDLHRASADERVGRFLVRLVADAPEHIHWIFAARERDALPEASLVEAGISIAHIGEDVLRLTADEAAEIARSARLDGRHVAPLFELTGGEPAAFHFGAHVFEAGDSPSGSVYEFYAGRYFERCPAQLRDLLLGICVLDEIDEELVKRSPWASGTHYLASLAQDGLVFSARDRERYRLHEPFRALLQERLGAVELGTAQRVGAELLEERGSLASALELYLQADDPSNVLRLCEQHGFDLADQGRLDVLRRALSRLGEKETQGSAAALALKAISESFAGRTDTAESWYLHALRLAQETQLRAAIAYRYAIDLIRQRRTESIQLLEPYAGDASVDGQLAAYIHSTLATAYVVASRFDDARAAMERALKYTASSDSVSLHATIRHQASWVSLFTGNAAEAKQHATRAVELALSCGLYDVAARAYSVLYNISYEIEDDAQASLNILNDIWDCGMKAGDVRMRLFALIGSFDIAAELGDTEKLARMERTLEAHEVDYADQMISESLLPAQALRVAAAGDFLEAFRLLSPTAERQITDDRRALRFAEIALYAAAAGQLPEARAAIAQVLERVDGLEPSMRRTLRTNAILAVALYLAGRRSDAMARLREIASPKQHPSLRIRVLTQTLEVLFARWDGAENFERVLDALQALRTSDFGGIAAVLAALPYKLPVSAA